MGELVTDWEGPSGGQMMPTFQDARRTLITHVIADDQVKHICLLPALLPGQSWHYLKVLPLHMQTTQLHPSHEVLVVLVVSHCQLPWKLAKALAI